MTCISGAERVPLHPSLPALFMQFHHQHPIPLTPNITAEPSNPPYKPETPFTHIHHESAGQSGAGRTGGLPRQGFRDPFLLQHQLHSPYPFALSVYNARNGCSAMPACPPVAEPTHHHAFSVHHLITRPHRGITPSSSPSHLSKSWQTSSSACANITLTGP